MIILLLPVQVYHDAANPIAQVWSVPLEGGKAAAALFNAGEQTHKIRLDFGMLGLPSDTRVKLRDLLNRKDLGTFGNSYAATVKPHDVLLLRVEVDSGSEQLAGSVNE